MSDTHHAEWLSLLDVSGPFLSPPVLERVFPQGLDAADADHAGKLRLAYEEWADEQQKPVPDSAIHDEWVRLVLTETLEFSPEVLLEGGAIPDGLELSLPEYGETVRPDFVVFDPEGEPGVRQSRLLISVYEPDQELDVVVAGSRWTASPGERMVQLCRATHVRLGLVTNGERWMLVDAPEGETSGLASWYASLWSAEPLTLRAFRSLLGVRRFFGVAETDRLEAMLAESATFQAEVTDQLGAQVRRAVEVLVQAIDRADADTGRTLLRDLPESRLYEAALTVMMRLVFLFSAEERDLLLLGDPTFDQHYAVSTLRAQLREAADQVGEEVLERREDAWSRLLAAFRAIFGGVDHESLHLRAYGSSLFDPDRFPFLEGRLPDSTWTEVEAVPLPIDNRTVLLLLESLQMLDLGKGRGARKLSFRALDIEQIGHVYETLLDHTAVRATEPMVSLQGNQGREPEIPVSKLHDLMLDDTDEKLVGFLKGELKKGVSPIRKALQKRPDPDVAARLLAACGGNKLLFAKVLPFHDLIRQDPWGDPVVIREGAVFVTVGEDRRSTGTHYTPRALTEEIVQYALEPVVYRGPAEGTDRDSWELKPPAELLDLKVCDPAMGSGAFLVQACRYLSERLVEAWNQTDHDGSIDAEGNPAGLEDAIPTDRDDQLVLARRLVADRCLYGVDINPLAVEMAKLSMWLITLAKDTPFSFLDHALKCGDSLLGVHDLDQIRYFHPDPKTGAQLHQTLFDPTRHIDRAVNRALKLRQELEAFTVQDIYDTQRKQQLHEAAEGAMDDLRLLGDLVMGAALALAKGSQSDLDNRLLSYGAAATVWLSDERVSERQEVARLASTLLSRGSSDFVGHSAAFHWPLEFPEVFAQGGGFDCFLSNPPFLGGLRISEVLGDAYNTHLARRFPPFSKRVDLCAYFFRRISQLLRPMGCAGLLATNTIAEGTTRKGGLDVLMSQGFNFYRAVKSFRWPGSASVNAAKVWYVKGDWTGGRLCSGVPCDFIGSLLEPQDEQVDFPEKLVSNTDRCLQGSVMWGKGFFLTDQEAQRFLGSDPRNARVVKQVIGGKELNSEVPIRPIRWAIDMGERSLAEVRLFQGPFQHLVEHVKPERDKRDPEKYSRITEAWWKYFHGRLQLYQGIETLGLTRVLARSRVSAYHAVAFLPVGIVYTDALVVFLYDDCGTFGVIQSSIHDLWASKYQSSLGTAPRYITTDCFHTFPLPPTKDPAWASLVDVGERYYQDRDRLMLESGAGLSALYRGVHDRQVRSPSSAHLRSLQVELDLAVASAFGWDDLDLGHGFVATPQGPRFHIGTSARREAIARLLDLNRTRHQEELAKGPLANKGSDQSLSRDSERTEHGTDSLFGEE